MNNDNKVFITGDLHGLRGMIRNDDWNRFLVNPNLTISSAEQYFDCQFTTLLNGENNYLIITGDSGVIWDEKIKEKTIDIFHKLAKKLGVKILLIDGNNDNLDELFSDNYPEQGFAGGHARDIRTQTDKTPGLGDVLLLKRGDIFSINGKSIFAFGGADTTTSQYGRKPGWWEQEQPAFEEFLYALNNLKNFDGMIDILLSHEQMSAKASATGNSHGTPTSRMIDILLSTGKFKDQYGCHHHDVNDVTLIIPKSDYRIIPDVLSMNFDDPDFIARLEKYIYSDNYITPSGRCNEIDQALYAVNGENIIPNYIAQKTTCHAIYGDILDVTLEKQKHIIDFLCDYSKFYPIDKKPHISSRMLGYIESMKNSPTPPTPPISPFYI